MKRCYKCREYKDGASFSKDRSRKDGLQPQCKDCDRTKAQEYNDRHPGKKSEYNKAYYRDRKDELAAYNRQYRYGISAEEFEAMLAEQAGGCAICRRSEPDVRLCVDHDHETSLVRGILCSNCNTAIGKLQDDPCILRAAATYLER